MLSLRKRLLYSKHIYIYLKWGPKHIYNTHKDYSWKYLHIFQAFGPFWVCKNSSENVDQFVYIYASWYENVDNLHTEVGLKTWKLCKYFHLQILYACSTNRYATAVPFHTSNLSSSGPGRSHVRCLLPVQVNSTHHWSR